MDLLDTWLGARYVGPVIKFAGTLFTRRNAIQLQGSAVTSVVDDDINKITIVTLDGSGGSSDYGPEISNSSTGAVNDAVSTSSGTAAGSIHFTGAAPALSGLQSGSARGPRPLTLHATGGPLVIKNEGTGSSATNRILTGTGGDVTLADEETAILVYDGASSRWRVVKFGGLSVSGTGLVGVSSGTIGSAALTSLSGITIVAASNTLTDTSAATGDILVHNGTKFVKKTATTDGTFLGRQGGTLDFYTPAAGGLTGQHTYTMTTSSQTITPATQILKFTGSSGITCQVTLLTHPASEAASLVFSIRNVSTNTPIIFTTGTGTTFFFPAKSRGELDMTPDGVSGFALKDDATVFRVDP